VCPVPLLPPPPLPPLAPEVPLITFCWAGRCIELYLRYAGPPRYKKAGTVLPDFAILSNLTAVNSRMNSDNQAGWRCFESISSLQGYRY